MADLKIKPEFRDLIPKLTDEEFAQLEANILEAGEVKEPIIVWNGFIVDGHHRWYIIEKHPEIPYRIEEMDFENEHAAMQWACRNQLGRRNLTSYDKKFLLNKQYEEAKLALGGAHGNQYTKVANDQNGDLPKGRTVDRIARENHVGAGTVQRAGEYVKGIDIAEEIVPGIKEEIRRGKVKVTDKIVEKIPKASLENQKKAVELISEGEMHKAEIVLDGDADLIDGLYDTGTEVRYTEDDMIQELVVNFQTRMTSIDTIMADHEDLLDDPDFRDKFINAFIDLLKAKISDLEDMKNDRI